jgi:hypothetical protein
MSDSEIRLECIQLAISTSSPPDVLRLAREFYIFVTEKSQ